MQHLFWMTPPWQIILFPFFLWGLYGLGSLWLPSFVFFRPEERIFLSGCLGVALTQSLVLLGLPIWVSIGAALVGCAVPLIRCRFTPRAAGLWILAAGTLLMIVGENLLGWDARAIWFFHGQLLYHAGQIFGVAWTNPELTLSHPDYPKGIAILSAQTSTLLGLWNERWPKLALIVLLSLTQTGICATRLSNWKVWLSNFALLAGIGYLMWNGYADGYLAYFTFLAALFFGRYLDEREPAQLWCGLGAVSLMAQTKNEGLVLGVILLALLGLASHGLRTDRSRILRSAGLWLLAAPILIWQTIRVVLGIHNDLGQAFVWTVPLNRLVDPGFWKTLISHWLSRGALMFWELALIGVLALVGWAPRLRGPAARLPISAFFVYACVVFTAYLTTYWPLLDHLRSSFSRVAIPLYTLLLAALLESLPKTKTNA
jgi:hypothetical protein